MVNRLRNLSWTFLFALCCLMSVSTHAQEVEISVDRTELARGETLTLTIRVYDQRQGVQLDLQPLADSFDVLGTRTSSQIRSINGAVESWTDYVVTLFPLEEGELQIPSLQINTVTTDPIDLVVVNEGPRSNQGDDELFLEIEVNKDSVYVQEQLLFTVRLFYTINGIRNPQFTELEMADTVTQLIGSPNQYEELIDGVRYGVYEKRYVIFPQRSGPLELPDILFRGEVTDGSSNFVFRNLNTRRVTAFIEGITIDVKERPAAAQSIDWLPARNLTLEEEWEGDLSNLQVGDSLLRTITIRAEGLGGAVLPPVATEEIEGMNVYPDPADIQRTFVEGSIVGTRIETATLVPTTSGEIVIPEVRVLWWNVDTDQQEVSVIPATLLNVNSIAGDVPAEQAVASTENLEELLESAPLLDQEMIDEQAQAEFIEVEISWMNYLIIAALAVVVLSIYRLVVAPKLPEALRAYNERRQELRDRYDPQNNEAIAFKQLQQACRKGDAAEVRNSLILWCGHYISERPVLSMEDILQQHQAAELHPFAADIQSALYNNSKSDTDINSDTRTTSPRELLTVVASLRNKKQQASKQQAKIDRYALPPLYKS